MNRPSLLGVGLGIALATGGCNHVPPGAQKSPPPDDRALKPLQAMKGAPVKEARDDKGRLVLGAGDLEVTLPQGWGAMRLGPQVTYRSPDMQETVHAFAYVADSPLDGDKQRDVTAALTEMGLRAERMLGVIGSGPQLGPPVDGHPPWGTTSAFTAIGPLNRVAFHFAAVSPRAALLVQLDGNTENEAADDATAIVRSARLHDGAAAAADEDEAPAPKKGAPAAIAPAPPAPRAASPRAK